MALSVEDSLIPRGSTHYRAVRTVAHVQTDVGFQNRSLLGITFGHSLREGHEPSFVQDVEDAALIGLYSATIGAHVVHEVMVVLDSLAALVVIVDALVVVAVAMLASVGKHLGMPVGKGYGELVRAQRLVEADCALVAIEHVAERAAGNLLRLDLLGVAGYLLAVTVQDGGSAGRIEAVCHIDRIVVLDAEEDRRGTLVDGHIANHDTTLQTVGMPVRPSEETAGILRGVHFSCKHTILEVRVVGGITNHAGAVAIVRSRLNDDNLGYHVLYGHLAIGTTCNRCRVRAARKRTRKDDVADGCVAYSTEKRNLAATYGTVCLVLRTHRYVDGVSLAVQNTKVAAGKRAVLFDIRFELDV